MAKRRRLTRKAIAIKPQGAYYNNLADAYAHSGDVDGAVKAYTEAATLDPTARRVPVSTSAPSTPTPGEWTTPSKAFQASVAADPTKAESYYQLGVSLVGKATTDKAGKVVPVPGTEEALQKYLELAPTGPNAEGAKGLLTYIGSTVETTFGKQKKGTKKYDCGAARPCPLDLAFGSAGLMGMSDGCVRR